MKISGVIILKNAVVNDYPFLESIHSLLPMVDEMIVSVDPGDDNTEEQIRSIHSDKVKIVMTHWDMTKRAGGAVYADETNKALDAVSPDADWIFYIQADEVIHEKDYSAILSAAKKYSHNDRVQGLLFRYIHFYGTYDYVGTGRQWYNYEVRMIKNKRSIRSYKDAQGFRIGNQKIKVVKVDADVYHYGWVKSPRNMKQKIDNTILFYNHDDEAIQRYKEDVLLFDFDNYGKLDLFNGTHPSVMKGRIERKNWTINFDLNSTTYSFKDQCLIFFEKLTGIRLFAFRNYKILRFL